jgi:hypothetical protein
MTPTAISAVVPRVRTTVAGRITGVRVLSRPWTRFEVGLSDGTGTIVLTFMGRRAVPGLVANASLIAEGTPALEFGRLIMRNPLYCFADGRAHSA